VSAMAVGNANEQQGLVVGAQRAVDDVVALALELQHVALVQSAERSIAKTISLREEDSQSETKTNSEPERFRENKKARACLHRS
jgi:hypothetical protein